MGTALGSESTALQTETTLGLPTGQKRRICGKNVINLLIFGFFLTFLAINLQADLWRILGISLVFFTFFFVFQNQGLCRLFLFVIFTHFFLEICRQTCGGSSVFLWFFSHFFWGQNQSLCRPVFCCCWYSHTLWQIYSQSFLLLLVFPPC